MRVLLIWPGHSHATIDVAAGYAKGLQDAGHQVRSFDYHNQLGFYKVALDTWMRRNRDFRPKSPGEATLVLASEQVIVEAVDFVPDVVLIVNGFALHRRAYDLLDRLCIPMAVILTESPYLDEQQVKIVTQGHVALAFTNDKSSVERLREDTGKPVVYLPHAYNPHRHHHLDATFPGHETDVFFFGTLWPERKRVLAPLQAWIRKQNTRAMLRLGKGTVRAQIGGVIPHQANGIGNDEMVRWYSRTQIALNHHRTVIGLDERGQERHVRQAYSLGPRAFEIAACGAFQLSDERPELRDVFGETVPTYAGPEDLLDKVQYYLAHPADREALAYLAQVKVKECTFKNRAEQIVIPALQRIR